MGLRPLASIIFASVILIGCTTACTSTAQDSLTPNNLNVEIAIVDPAPPTVGVGYSAVRITVTMFEDLSYSQARVAVSESDTFSCDGTTLIHDGSLQYSFLASIPASQAQGTQSCAYTHNGKSTPFSFATPQRPAILAPLPSARITTAQNLTVQITPSQQEPTVLTLDGKEAITLAPPIGEVIIPSKVLQQSFDAPTLSLGASQTSRLMPVSGFNDLEIEYTSSTTMSLSISN
jgi:hypothetical protein